MKLEQIGFYTLSDERAKNSSHKTPLQRCELILTDKCNFSCPYCMGIRSDCQGTLTFEQSMNILNLWIKEGLRNVRFSGGEPTDSGGVPEQVFTGVGISDSQTFCFEDTIPRLNKDEIFEKGLKFLGNYRRFK